MKMCSYCESVADDWSAMVHSPSCSTIQLHSNFLHEKVFSEGLKFDSDKPYQPELIAPEFIFSLSEVLAYGAKKYAPRNWEKGMAWSRPFGAMMRHMWAWWKGEAKDPETGFSHLAHAACCLMFLLAYESRASGTDDRYIGGK